MEEELVARARAGDATAFAQLVEHYETSVYNLCYRMLGDAAEAEWVAQRVFVHAFDQLSAGAAARSFGLWLLTISKRDDHLPGAWIRRRRLYQQ